MLQGPIGFQTHGPLGTLWVAVGLIAFYIALIWINTLLGLFLTPLLTGIPFTWLMDAVKRRRARRECRTDMRPRRRRTGIIPSG